MNEQRREKALKILELAMLINNESIKQKLAGKPSIIVNFGECVLGVRAYLSGWFAGAGADLVWYIILDSEKSDEQLDNCLEKLTEICEKWIDEV